MNGPGNQGNVWLVNPLSCIYPLFCVFGAAVRCLVPGLMPCCGWFWFVVPRGVCFVWVGGTLLPPGLSYSPWLACLFFSLYASLVLLVIEFA
jgi:hypothetical protein